MSERNIKSRVILKHDVEANWLKSSFIPMKGEVVIFDIDENYSYERFKLGDGVSDVNSLPFATKRPDWSVNDENDPAYIQNRTHWTEKEFGEIVQYKSIDLSTGSVMGVLDGVSLKEGDTYVVFWDRTEYECVAKDDGYGEIYIGNQTLANGWEFPETIESNEPFFIWTYGDSNNEIMGSAANHTFALYGYADIAHPLDEMYIPDTIARMNDVLEITYPDKTLSFEERPADAKTTGDAISEVRTLIGDTSVAEQISNAPTVTYVTQDLTDEQKAQARANIGAGTTSYADLTDKPAIPTGKSTVAAWTNSNFKAGDLVYVYESEGGGSYSYLKHSISTGGSDRSVSTMTVSPDGSLLVVGGGFTGKAQLYSRSSNGATLIDNIYADNSETLLTGTVNRAVFSPDGTMLVLVGAFNGKAKLYSVSDGAVTYVSDIAANSTGTALSSTAYSARFSPDGGTLVITGFGYGKSYSVSDGRITYLSEIYADANNTALSSYVQDAAFSPDGSMLVLVGGFSGRAKLYSVSGNTITYKSEIYANATGSSLSATAYGAAFSPDGRLLCIVGHFSGAAKLYNVSNGTATFLTNVNIEHSSSIRELRSVSFSSDGTVLAIAGLIGNRCAIYLYKMEYDSPQIMYGMFDFGTSNGSSSYTKCITFVPNSSDEFLAGWDLGAGIFGIAKRFAEFVSDEEYNKIASGTDYIVGIVPEDCYKDKIVQITILAHLHKNKDIPLPKVTTVTLSAANWVGNTNPWSQAITMNGVTANSKIDLQLTAVQIVELQNADIMFMVENNDGVTTAYAIGGKPEKDYSIQALITEVIPV